MSGLKKILIIHPEGNTFNNPTLKCIVDLLREKNIEIYIKYSQSLAPMPMLNGIKLFPYTGRHKKIKNIIFDKIAIQWLIELYVRLTVPENLSGFEFILGVDRQGLIEAAALSRIYGLRCVFISFEIMFEAETGLRYKNIERKASRQIKYWFVQDEIRKQCLIEENNLPEKDSVLVPLASAGKGVFDKKRLRDELAIPIGKKVAILIGSIANWSMAKEIIESVSGWSEDWVLIIHNRYGDTKKAILGLNLNKSLLLNKIFISDYASDMVDDMGYILNGISAGFAFYKPDYNGPYTGKNLENMGFSSGKISTYLRYGVPVIMNEIGLYSELAKAKKFGFVINGSDEIPKVLEIIGLKEDQYRKQAINYFMENLDFNNYKDLVFRSLDLYVDAK